MGTYTTTRTVSGGAAAVLTAALEAARAVGYELVKRSPTRLDLKFTRGSAFAWNVANNAHKLAISAAGSALLFEFELGWNTGGDPKEHLESRTDAIASAATSAAAPPSPTVVQQIVHVQAPAVQPTSTIVERQVLVQRCRYCQKLTPVDLTACSECGAKL